MPIIVLLALAFANDWVIVPGSRVGPITATTVRQDLIRDFSKDAVQDEEIELDEGMLQPATLIYKTTPSQTLAISWGGKGSDAHPKQVFVCFGRRRGVCRWEVSGGIHIGTRLTELESMNGKPFTVSGFGYNYGGNVQSWDGGKLEKLDPHGTVVLTLDGERVRGDFSVEMTREEVHAVSGDRPISSGVAAMQKLNPGVVGILFRFRQP